MQESLERITHWITINPPLFLTDKPPAADNPFLGLALPAAGEYQGSLRLGFIYQELCRRLFDSHPDYRLLADEVQLRDGKETIGAIDFLLEHSSPEQGKTEIEHWEVALKFYLLKDGLWYGPDSRDRLDKKLHRMLTHQLRMSQFEVFGNTFPDLHDVVPRMLVHGRLYINPFENGELPADCLGYGLNPEVLRGYWCYQHQIGQIGEPLYRLPKMDWITGMSRDGERLTSLPEYSVHCQAASGQFWIVVPDSWPDN